jgi:tetratricopeptide (TPR) repeat protein
MAAAIDRALSVGATNVTAALDALDAADPARGDPAAGYVRGHLLEQDGRLDEAAVALRAALALAPGFQKARAGLARVELLRNDPRAAVDLCAELVRGHAASADDLLVMGHALLALGRWVSAESAYRQCLLSRPDDRGALEGLARALLEQERYAECAALLRERLDEDWMRGDLWALAAHARLALGDSEGAIAALESADRLGLAAPDALATLGDLYLSIGQAEQAAAVYTALCARVPESRTYARRAAEGLLMLGDATAAAPFLERAHAAVPAGADDRDERRALLRLDARMAQQTGRADDASGSYRELLRDDPLDAAAMLALGDIERDAGRPAAAAMQYERAARVAGYEARALTRLARTAVEDGRYREAVGILERAQAFDERADVARYLAQVRRLADLLEP